ncbi:hypothetical protein O0I10_012910 [Lichtheimia ornata]|uniref:Uncharacterized protein n=1 Tax=Lichtheimia ornata TaxID=688661 RepID=A0AAD7XVD7_9FUNG|nr:uncharacterized protein O0I10_012910 [Lichtheimia ornata]KAJ8651532.1 hypothetical protein O0I10_012910 [Lichtheimia ornata]
MVVVKEMSILHLYFGTSIWIYKEESKQLL